MSKYLKYSLTFVAYMVRPLHKKTLEELLAQGKIIRDARYIPIAMDNKRGGKCNQPYSVSW